MLRFMWQMVPQVLHGDELCSLQWTTKCLMVLLQMWLTKLFYDTFRHHVPRRHESVQPLVNYATVTWDPRNRHRQPISLFFTKTIKKKTQRAKKNGQNDIPLKVAVVNCRSIAKKKPELLNLLEATQADVIIGTESWLTDSISDSEICPPGYTMFRKDRASGIGGGVFLMISSEFVCSDPGFPCPKEVEMVWAQI